MSYVRSHLEYVAPGTKVGLLHCAHIFPSAMFAKSEGSEVCSVFSAFTRNPWLTTADELEGVSLGDARHNQELCADTA